MTLFFNWIATTRNFNWNCYRFLFSQYWWWLSAILLNAARSWIMKTFLAVSLNTVRRNLLTCPRGLVRKRRTSKFFHNILSRSLCLLGDNNCKHEKWSVIANERKFSTFHAYQKQFTSFSPFYVWWNKFLCSQVREQLTSNPESKKKLS